MIKIRQVNRSGGDVWLKIDYTQNGDVKNRMLNADEIAERARVLRSLIRRPLKPSDFKDLLVGIAVEWRQNDSQVETLDYESYIGVDLEA